MVNDHRRFQLIFQQSRIHFSSRGRPLRMASKICNLSSCSLILSVVLGDASVALPISSSALELKNTRSQRRSRIPDFLLFKWKKSPASVVQSVFLQTSKIAQTRTTGICKIMESKSDSTRESPSTWNNKFQSLETAEAIPEHTSHTSQRNKAGIKKKRLLVSSEKLASKDKLPRISSTHYLLLAIKAKLALFLMINIFKLNNKRHCQIIVVMNRNSDYWLHEQVERLFGISIRRK